MTSSRTGHEVAGRYVLEETLGRGGMGVVWRAQDKLLGRRVALKEVEPPHELGAEERETLRARVLREARAAAQLSHPGAIVVYDVVEESGTTYIAMELVEAPTLTESVKSRGPVSEAEAARIGIALLDTLEAAHSSGIVHRDVKPSNVIVTPDGAVKLADFGIASVKGDPQLTTSGLILGSPAYMSPEQARGEPAGPAADLWGLGATLYFAVEGQSPFPGDQPITTLAAIVNDDHPPPQRAAALTPLISALLAKDPNDRPDIGETRRALESAIKPEPTTLAMSPPTEVETAPAPRATPVVAHVPQKRDATAGDAPRVAPWLVAVGIVALLAVGAAFALPRLGSDDADRRDGRRERRERAGAPANQTAEQEDDSDQAGAPPAESTGDMTEYTIGTTSYAVSYPADWSVVDDPLDDASSARFEDAEGRYLLVDWTDTPGESAAEAWEQSSAGFPDRHDNYVELRIEETTFLDFATAAVWEYTYTEGGADLHAINLGFANDDWGFALNFQTHEEDWEASLDTFEAIKESFREA